MALGMVNRILGGVFGLIKFAFVLSVILMFIEGFNKNITFIQEGKFKYIPYNRLFRRTEFIEVEGYGKFEVYANRNSLKYQNVYGLENILTLYRGTIRRVGFSKAWNMFVHLGMTDDTYTIPNSETLSYLEFVNSFLPYSPTDTVALKLRHSLKIDQDDLMWNKIEDLDILNP